MSDVNTPNIDDTDGGGMFSGSDKKPSIRRVTGFLSFIAGLASLGYAMFKLPIERALNIFDLIWFAPGTILLVVALYLFKMFTAQNIQAIIEATKKDK